MFLGNYLWLTSINVECFIENEKYYSFSKGTDVSNQHILFNRQYTKSQMSFCICNLE